jgi:metal-sulfur cluster biosynthetic enzyme
MSRTDEVLGALSSVRDPELDEPLPDLGFVTAVEVDDDVVEVRLRLPTYFCAPNFAYLMVAEATAAVSALGWVGDARVRLEDHFSAAEINGAVAGGAGFAEAFPGEVRGDVNDLLDLFARKALMARQASLVEAIDGGHAPVAKLCAMRLGELPDGPDRIRFEGLRRQLGLPMAADSAAFVTADGTAVEVEDMPRFLRMARLIRVSIDGNAGLCRSLLSTRYGLDKEEVPA